MNHFNWNQIPKVYFGQGSMEEAFHKELKDCGKNIMLAYGGGSIKRTGIYDEILSILKKSGKNVHEFGGIMPNPTYDKVKEGAEFAKKNGIDYILAVGGGSTFDCCKIISAQAKTERDLWEMELDEKKFPSEFIPMAAVVTVSGTGAEMNPLAGIINREKSVKLTLTGALAEFVVLDPAYTLTVPMDLVLSGAFDTLSHCMEIYFGKPLETNVSDEINESIMRNVILNTRAVQCDPTNVNARSELMWDSSIAEMGLLKLGKTTDFQIHAIENQLGVYANTTHGKGLAVLHPPVYRHIFKEGLSKFVRYAKEVWHIEETGKSKEEVALAGIEALTQFIKEIGLPVTLTEMGITDKSMLQKVSNSVIIKEGCCKQLSQEEIYEILLESL